MGNSIRDRAGRWSTRCYTEGSRKLGTTDICIADYSKGASDQIEQDTMKLQKYFLDLRLTGSPVTSGMNFEEFEDFIGNIKELLKDDDRESI